MKTPHPYYPVFSFRFLRALIIHMRPYLLFVSGAAGLAGMALGRPESQSVVWFILVFVPFFLGYGFGQALTDCFQVDTDSISATYRPLVKKEISPRALGTVSLIGLVVIGIPLIYFNTNNLFFCALTIIGLATYTWFKKNFWMAGPFYNGWIVMLLPVMGFLASSGQQLSSVFNKTMLLVCLISLFSYADFVLIGYLKDITADRQTGYLTFPVKYGWDRSVWLADLFLAVVILAGILLIDFQNYVAFGVFVLAFLNAISGQLTAHFQKTKTEENAAYPITATVRAFILWHLAIALNFQPRWFLFSVIFYFAFEVILFFRPEKSQI